MYRFKDAKNVSASIWAEIQEQMVFYENEGSATASPSPRAVFVVARVSDFHWDYIIHQSVCTRVFLNKTLCFLGFGFAYFKAEYLSSVGLAFRHWHFNWTK